MQDTINSHSLSDRGIIAIVIVVVPAVAVLAIRLWRHHRYRQQVQAANANIALDHLPSPPPPPPPPSPPSSFSSPSPPPSKILPPLPTASNFQPENAQDDISGQAPTTGQFPDADTLTSVDHNPITIIKDYFGQEAGLGTTTGRSQDQNSDLGNQEPSGNSHESEEIISAAELVGRDEVSDGQEVKSLVKGPDT